MKLKKLLILISGGLSIKNKFKNFLSFSNKKLIWLLVFVVLIFSCINFVSAEDNTTQNDIAEISNVNQNMNISYDGLNLEDYKFSNSAIISDSNSKSLLLISDKGGTNVLDSAACEILDSGNYSNLDIQVRNGGQISNMNETELYNIVKNSDIVIINWLDTDADATLTNLLLKHPNLSDKELFLVLETSSSSSAKSFNLIRNNTINFEKIFSDNDIYSSNFLKEYFSKTKRGNDYTEVVNYISKGNGKKVNSLFNKMVLFKDCNNKENQLNQILFALNSTEFECTYKDPIYNSEFAYGIYREKYMTLEEYINTYFDKSRPYTVGLLESNMYVSSQALGPYYELIKSLESKGCNVIPVVAAGGSDNQLRVMVNSFTNAPNYESYLANSSKYSTYVDAIISMPAYGIGGTLFDNTTLFFEKAGAPVFRAVHSDYLTNEQWELSSSGLPVNKSDKWWHVTIGEAQSINEATFVGGLNNAFSSKTGAQRTDYVPHLKNIDLFTDRITSWIDLKYVNNSEKKISLIYYNYPPGKQNIGSSYLDSITSIFNLLQTLKNEGYNVGTLPNNVSELEDMMIKCGINVANWAPGELEKLANRSNVVLLPVSEYMEWFNNLEPISRIQVIEGPVAYIGELARHAVAINYISTMPKLIADWYNGIIVLLPDNYTDIAIPILKNIVNSLNKYINTTSEDDYNLYIQYKEEFKALNIPGLNGWGDAPGNIMTVTKNNTQYFVIPGLIFGNIFVAPEPQRGWEADSDILYHSSAVAPTHQYLAAYYYMQRDYSSAMVFVGRHATHEWLPGKEVLLSTTDYGSILVGDVPQIYFYISDGLAEGLQAKRRGFAIMISHLTSPLAYTTLYGNLTTIANLINSYENTFDENIKANLASEIKTLIIANNFVQSMGITQAEFNKLNNNELVNLANDFLFSIQRTLYPLGLHALGQNWTDKDLAFAVSSALSQDFEYNGITTNLYDELSRLKYSKNFDELNAIQRDIIINSSANVIMSLIYYTPREVATILGSTSESLITSLEYSKYYLGLIQFSIKNEIDMFNRALNGGYIPPCPGGDILDINSLPTGGNFFHDQSQELPTEEAYNYGKILTLLSLSTLTDDVEKLVMGIWCVETARDDGALVSVVLYLLGMEPVYTSSPSAGGSDENGDRVGVKTKPLPNYVPLDKLVRPEGWDKKRIDVTIIVSGNFRDLYSTQISLMDNGFRVALLRSYFTILNNKTLMESKWGNEIKEGLNFIAEGISYYGVGRESLDDNYVAKHWLNDFMFYKDLGYNTTYAAECAITRIFAPPNGDFGAGISKAVSLSWTWNDTSELADFYLNRMGNMYSKNYWGETNPIVFIRALNNTGDLIVSRNTNVYGVADNDDFFDYWGGLSMAIEAVNGKTPNMNVLMYGDKNNPYISSIEQVLSKETISRYFNPEWIKGMMSEGYSGARYISNKFLNNLLGWSVTRPTAVGNWMWDEAYNVYLKDKYNLGVTDWLHSGNNNYALISSTGTMLTAAYEGYWKTDSQTLTDIANTWANSIVANGVACCDCSCGNLAMMEWAVQYINADLLANLMKQLYTATQNPMFMLDEDEELPDVNINTQDPATSNNGESSNPNSNNPSDSVSKGGNSTLIAETATSGSSQSYSGASVGLESSESSASSSVVNSASPSDEGSESESGEKGESYEVSKKTTSKSSEVSMSIPSLLAIIALVVIFAIGYVKGKKEKK